MVSGGSMCFASENNLKGEPERRVLSWQASAERESLCLLGAGAIISGVPVELALACL